ncbi:telomere-protecting terminal protein Tpg [Streptomyces longwoodensis]|uniref:telomere-protecting terminal protein Tpg n=1 Tax=Streptomyces longwoodensis TaxID=68231 RepID=UPI00378FC0EC
MPLRLSADTVGEALDRADSRHWTRTPPRSPHARLAYVLKHHHDTAALARHLHTTTHDLDALHIPRQTPQDHPLHQALEREVIRLWQPRVRRRAHNAILAHDGQMMLSFRAWLGFTAAAGSSDDPRLRFLTLSLTAPYRERLFTAQHNRASEADLRAILSEALGVCYFYRDRPAHTREKAVLERIDFLEFYY